MFDSSLPLLKPALYARGDDGAPVLLGGRCECGHVFFPMQTFGCERCGKFGAALQPLLLQGRGELRSAATVHVHADAARPAPFVIGTIALDDGPVIRTLLIPPVTDYATSGIRVEAVLSPVEIEDGEQALDLRFRAVRP
jgi:uncharacterized OB-fold protein